MDRLDQTLTKLSGCVLECKATKQEKEQILKLLADLVLSLMERDANE